MNLLEEIKKMKEAGYNEANAQARICQDIILYGISKGEFSRNITIKGGVVMRNLSKDARRATQDIDLDFIKYSISDEAIRTFIEKLYLDEGIHISLMEPVIELKHRDYRGKRVFVEITDDNGNVLESKIDIGVHKDLDIEQEECCFDICFQEDGASLLMNSREQIITEKLKSFLRFGAHSTRYKDVFDMCYLSENVNRKKLLQCIQRYIYEDPSLHVNDMDEIIRRVERVFRNNRFIKEVHKSGKNWTDISVEETMERNITFVNSLKEYKM